MGDISAEQLIFSPPQASPAADDGCAISEFERALIRRIAEEAGQLATDIVTWHHNERDVHYGALTSRLAHGLGVAALGALVMQILSWVRLVETPGVGAETLRTARQIIDGPDPEAEPVNLGLQARALLVCALGIKNKARRLSRNW